jgi:hypothetical protein
MQSLEIVRFQYSRPSLAGYAAAVVLAMMAAEHQLDPSRALFLFERPWRYAFVFRRDPADRRRAMES